jgi:glycerol-3-phosphate acyltransferase PlsX
MKIIIDAMGGDHAPEEIVKGALLARQDFGVDLILVGRETEILHALQAQGNQGVPEGIQIVAASEVVGMEDDPATVIRQKKDSSMVVGLRMLHEGAADAMVSAGSTGALLSGATLITKRIRGIRRAALAPVMPSQSGHGVLLIDCGANAECTPEYLMQFAYMGAFYAKTVMQIETPRVGLLNIGAEETKGTPLQKETYALLKAADEQGRICFAGNAEARDVLLGGFDVVVADGYTGNILLKGIEGVGIYMVDALKGMFLKNLRTKIAALLVKKDMKAFKQKLDPSEIGGTMLLGISKPVIKAHGSSKAYAIRNAVKQAIACAESDVCGAICKNIACMKVDESQTE